MYKSERKKITESKKKKKGSKIKKCFSSRHFSLRTFEVAEKNPFVKTKFLKK
jgi:hypothetical protein